MDMSVWPWVDHYVAQKYNGTTNESEVLGGSPGSDICVQEKMRDCYGGYASAVLRDWLVVAGGQFNGSAVSHAQYMVIA